jgi:hypothetical protein
MDVSGRILRTWMPAIHAGMTKLSIFILCRQAQAHESLHGSSHSKTALDFDTTSRKRKKRRRLRGSRYQELVQLTVVLGR